MKTNRLCTFDLSNGELYSLYTNKDDFDQLCKYQYNNDASQLFVDLQDLICERFSNIVLESFAQIDWDLSTVSA